MNNKPIILLDNGHGENTIGKRSPIWPDGSQLFEYEFNRDIVSRIAKALIDLRISHKILVPEITDVSLRERCYRANSYDNAILISVHGNAGGGVGFEVWTSIGETKADVLASILYWEAEKELAEFRMRQDVSDKDPDKESQFYILKNSNCPAILSENLFMDTEVDCRFMMSEDGRKRIADFHIKAIVKMLEVY